MSPIRLSPLPKSSSFVTKHERMIAQRPRHICVAFEVLSDQKPYHIIYSTDSYSHRQPGFKMQLHICLFTIETAPTPTWLIAITTGLNSAAPESTLLSVVATLDQVQQQSVQGGIQNAGSDLYLLTPETDLGGCDLWSTPPDFNSFLWHLFLKDDGLLTPQSLSLITSQQATSSEVVTKQIRLSNGGMLTKAYPTQIPPNIGVGSTIALHDIPGQRPKGSIGGVGLPSVHWVSFTAC
ncbi:hypothetical protein SNK04_007411 [Fusarium graminearum]